MAKPEDVPESKPAPPPGSAGNITPGQAATSERTPVASEAAHGIANGDMPVKSSATDHVPEAAEGPAPGAAPSVDDAAIDPEAHLADFAGRFSLTPRETEVLAAATADERPLKHVAADMGISLRVLQRHLTSLYPHETVLGVAPFAHAPCAQSHVSQESCANNRQTPRNRSLASLS